MLDDPNLADFEITISELKAIALQDNITKESMDTEEYAKNHKIEMIVRWFETNDETIKNDKPITLKEIQSALKSINQKHYD